MGSIFWVFLVVAGIHIFEEYGVPGGFPQAMKRMRPGWASVITPGFHFAVNAAFLLLVLAAALVGERNLVFSLSVAGLLLVNAMMHLGGTIIGGGYMPGLITAIVLYIPLSVYAFATFLCMGSIDLRQITLAGLLALLYQAVPLAALGIAKRIKG